MVFLRICVLIILIGLVVACKQQEKQQLDLHDWNPIKVTVTAYNSLPSQTTQNKPNIAAWGDTLKPGMKVVAVSRDLMRKGLTYNTMVRIDTFPDTFIVKDKMHYRHRNKIDLYMGRDKKRALEWGKKKLVIFYSTLKDTTNMEQIPDAATN